MKSYQFFKICTHFDKERETLMQQSMRKEKLRKLDFFCFITGSFIKSFNMTSNHFFVSQAHSNISYVARNIKRGIRDR